MTTMNISLPDPMRERVEAQTEGGLYSNNRDYIRDLFRRDRLRAKKPEAMQAAITQGPESGIAEDFDMDKIQKGIDLEWLL